MRKTRHFLLILAGILFSFSAMQASEIKVKEFRVLDGDFKAESEPVMDLDRNYCAVLRIDGSIPDGLALEEKVYKTEKLPSGEIYLYISAMETQITFEAPGFTSLTVDVPDGELMLGKVYYVRLKTIIKEEIPSELPVLIASHPEGAKIVLNNQKMGLTNGKFKLKAGTYELLLGKPGYEITAVLIEVKEDQKNIFAFNLIPKEGTQTPPPPPAEELPGNVVFFENFEDNNLDNWIKLSGEWTAAGGYLMQSSQARPAVILTGNEKVDNYVLEFDAKKSSGSEGFYVIIGSKMNNKTCLSWNVGGWGNKMSVLLSYRDIIYNQFNKIKATESRFSVQENKWYHVKVIVNGTHIECYLDKNKLIDYDDPEVAALSTGRIGIGTYRTKAYFDNVKLTRLP